MLVKHPFFATLMMGMPMVLTTDIPTCGDRHEEAVRQPGVRPRVDDDVLMFVVAHEIMHTALEHGIRQQTPRPDAVEHRD
jgi:hypothetical protein